jgi:trehalose-6-phosphatase
MGWHASQAAEEKKLAMRRHLEAIREEFQELLRANERRAESERLAATELEIDPGLRAMIEVRAAKSSLGDAESSLGDATSSLG